MTNRSTDHKRDDAWATGLARLRVALVRLWRRRRWFRRRESGTEVCREGWYYLVLTALVFFAAMMLSVNLLLILAGMMVGPILFSWRLVGSTLRRLEVRRKLPHGICAGDQLVVPIEAINPRRRLGSWAVVVEEQIRREGDGARPIRPTVYFSYIPAGQSLANSYRGRLPRRGRYTFGPLRISTRFPFGLLRYRRTIGQTDALVVLPRLGRLTRAWLARRHESFEGGSRRERRHSRVSGDFYGVRQWTSGDSRRWIHWRSSAKHGELVVRQFEQHRNRDVALLVDLWHPSKPSPTDLENLELAVSFAATVASETCRKGGANLLLGKTCPSPEFVAGPASLAMLRDALEWLAVAEASDGDGLAELLTQVLARVEPGTELILVSTRPIDLRNGPLTAQLDPGRRAALRHVRTVDTSKAELGEYFVVE